jgi:hypothetical protein
MILGHKQQREIAQANPEKKKGAKKSGFFFLQNPFQCGRLTKDAQFSTKAPERPLPNSPSTYKRRS